MNDPANVMFGPTFFDRVGTWNEDLTIPLDAGDAQSSILQLNLLDATLREDGLKTCTFRLGDFVPWNGYHLDVRQATNKLKLALFFMASINYISTRSHTCINWHNKCLPGRIITPMFVSGHRI